MNLIKKALFLSLLIPFFFSSCATIIGGSNYYAHIEVLNKQSAKIIYKNEVIGRGTAAIKVKRKNAYNFSFSVKEDSCYEQKYTFRTRAMRGWAFAGSIFFWTGLINGIPLPWGTVVDLATGAVYKPNT